MQKIAPGQATCNRRSLLTFPPALLLGWNVNPHPPTPMRGTSHRLDMSFLYWAAAIFVELTHNEFVGVCLFWVFFSIKTTRMGEKNIVRNLSVLIGTCCQKANLLSRHQAGICHINQAKMSNIGYSIRQPTDKSTHGTDEPR